MPLYIPYSNNKKYMVFSNKFTKFAVGNAIGTIVLFFFWSPIAILFSLLAIGFGIKGLIDYKRDNSIGGKIGSIVAIIIGIIFLIIVLLPIFQTIFPDKMTRDFSNLLEGNCEKLEKGSSSQAFCYGEKAVEMNDISLCDKISGDSRWSCIKKFAVHSKDDSLCLQIPATIEGDLAYLRTNCLIDVVVETGNAATCENIDKQEMYTNTISSYNECMDYAK